MKYRVLGPLRVVGDNGAELSIGGPVSQRIVAMLLLNANRVVSVARLTEATWDGEPPATARRQVQNRLAALRATLIRHGGRLDSNEAGYQLRAADDELDARWFDALVREARDASDPERERALLRAALALFEGPVLAGLGGRTLEQEAARLDETRLAVLGDCLDLELAAGQHARVVPELRQLVAEHPLRERFVGQWMIALGRTGRRSEALDAYRGLRQRLVDDLGIEPGPQLQDIHRMALTGELSRGPRTEVAAGPPVPRQLPTDIAAFTGRREELDRLRAILAGDRDGGPVVISAIEGVGGIGKSALAIHLAHRLADRFPDGQLYADLQGATAGLPPLPPAEVLSRFLRALGVPGDQLPTGVAEAAARFRSQVAGRRILVVLDNARDTAQVAPLLPGSASCAVLVTSRRALGALPGAHHLPLAVLPEEEAVAQLAQVAGEERVRAEPAAAVEVARWCGRLPLALRIAGARLAARPGWTLAALAERLADTQRRLDELELTDASVRTCLALSHRELRDSTDPLDRAAADSFALLSLLDGPDVGLPAAAHLLQATDPVTERVLERLVDANLLETPTPGRYRLHDLLRLYGREHATQSCTEPQRAAAVGRVIDFYLATVWGAYDLVRPGDYRSSRVQPCWRGTGLTHPDAATALDWLETERPNLVAAVHQAAATPGMPPQAPIQLAHALYGPFRLRGYWAEVVEVNQVAIAVAGRVGDAAAEAAARTDLGVALSQSGHHEEAIGHLERGMAMHRSLGDLHGLAQSLRNLGVAQDVTGHYDQAHRYYHSSLLLYQQLGDRRGQAMSLGNLGPIHRRKGHFQQALDCHQRAMDLFSELGDRYGRAVGLTNLGLLYQLTDRLPEAVSCLRDSLAVHRDMGDRYGEASALTALGSACRRQHRLSEALAHHQRAELICREVGRRDGQAEALRELGLTLRELGERDRSETCLRRAIALFDELQSTDADDVRALLAATRQP